MRMGIESDQGPVRKEGESGHYKGLSYEILYELGSIGAGNAATALSELIHRKISINVPNIHIVSPLKIPDILKFYDMHTVVVIAQLTSNMECDMLLVFPVEEAKKLVDFMAQGLMDGELTENITLIEELGNIIIGNFLNAISDFTGIMLQPTPPTHVVDLFDAILDMFLANISLQERDALLFDARMRCDEEDIHGAILMFISRELQEKLIERSEDWLD